MDSQTITRLPWIVVGGGVAGVSCVEGLAETCGGHPLVLISASDSLKGVTTIRRVTSRIEEFDVALKSLAEFSTTYPHVRVICDTVRVVDLAAKWLRLERSGESISFARICFCTGARPRLLLPRLNRVPCSSGGGAGAAVRDSDPLAALILGIRDTHSVAHLQARLRSANRIVLVGNGGIALEIAYSVRSCALIWATKDHYIGNTFFDASAGAFLAPLLKRTGPVETGEEEEAPGSGTGGASSTSSDDGGAVPSPPTGVAATSGRGGAAVGPQWSTSLRRAEVAASARGLARGPAEQPLTHERGCQVRAVRLPGREWVAVPAATSVGAGDGDGDDGAAPAPPPLPPLTPAERLTGMGGGAGESESERPWPLFVLLTNGRRYGCDFLVSATGVVPNVPAFVGDVLPALDAAGALVVDDALRVQVEVEVEGSGSAAAFVPLDGAWAAGDCCAVRLAPLSSPPPLPPRGWCAADDSSATTPLVTAPHWFQMRLWSQARATGSLAAHSMRGALSDVLGGFCFEIFQHATRFFGMKVVLLGRFNGAGLPHMADVTANVVVSQKGVRKGGGGRGGGGGGGGGQSGEGSSAATGAPSARKRVRPSRQRRAPAAAAASTSSATSSKRSAAAAASAAPATSALVTPAEETTILVRCTPGREYIKAVLYRGRMVGAMLVGETDLEETFHNLILNQLDISALKDNLLTDCVDIEDYFD